MNLEPCIIPKLHVFYYKVFLSKSLTAQKVKTVQYWIFETKETLEVFGTNLYLRRRLRLKIISSDVKTENSKHLK